MDISRLKSELSWLRRKGAIKVGQETGSNPRACGRCQAELGLILNRGAPCPSCRQRVCKECRQHGPLGKDWVCIVCSKQIEIQLATGEWMNEFIRRPSRRRDKNFVSAAEGVRKTLLRRSWSISSPTTSSCDLPAAATNDSTSKRKPPKKPPRKSLEGDENEPPLDGFQPCKPPRRNSMTSYDTRRSLRGTADSGARRDSQDFSFSGINGRRTTPRAVSTQHLAPNHEPPRYFFGSEPPIKDYSRPSTLPRRPSASQRPLSFGDFEDNSTRFHSIPRRAHQHRSPSGDRGRSAPAPFKDNTISYISSGPVTTTPISPSSPNGPSFPFQAVEKDHLVGRSPSVRSEGRIKHSPAPTIYTKSNFEQSWKTNDADDEHRTFSRRSSKHEDEHDIYSREVTKLGNERDVFRKVSRSDDEHDVFEREANKLEHERDIFRRMSRPEIERNVNSRDKLEDEHDVFRKISRPDDKRDVFSREVNKVENDREIFRKISRPKDDCDVFNREVSRSKDDRDVFSREVSRSKDDRDVFSREVSRSKDDRDVFSREVSRSKDDRDIFSRSISRSEGVVSSADRRNQPSVWASDKSVDGRSSPPLHPNVPVPPLPKWSSSSFGSPPKTDLSPLNVKENDKKMEERSRKLNRPEIVISVDRTRSESSVYHRDAEEGERTSPPRLTQKGSATQLPRSNTSVTSGLSSTLRPKRASSAPVRRCKSLLSGNSKKCVEEELSPRRISGSHVAKFVLQLEKGIQETIENMNPKKASGLTYSESFKEPSSATLKTTTSVSRSSSRRDRSPDESTFPSVKMSEPEGNDYKIVFISSDSSKESSKESEMNSSVESEESSYTADKNLERRSSRWTPPEGSLGQTRPMNIPQKCLNDAAVMTDSRVSSSCEEDGLKQDFLLRKGPTDPYDGMRAEVPENSFGGSYKWSSSKRNIEGSLSKRNSEETNERESHPSLVPPLNALDKNELELMFQQTEVVQAEAQALQKALMGAFDPNRRGQNFQNGELIQSRNPPRTMNLVHRNQISSESLNFKPLMEGSSKDSADSTSFERQLSNPFVSSQRSEPQNEYENVQIFGRTHEGDNSYENVNFRSDCVKPVKACKSVYIQTDFQPSSGDDEESYETGDYSDVSFDSTYGQEGLLQKPVQPNVRATHASDKHARQPVLSHRGLAITERNKCNRRKGEETFTPPFSYLPENTPSTTLPFPHAVHLRLASPRDSSSVSLSSECEAVRESVSAIRDQAAVFNLPGSDKNGVERVSYEKVNAVTKCCHVRGSAGARGNCISPLCCFECRKTINDESNARLEPSSDLTSGGHNNSFHPPISSNRLLKSCLSKVKRKPKVFFRMSSNEEPEIPSTSASVAVEDSARPPSSNVNASEEVISAKECANEALLLDATDALLEEHSSGTSDGEDTDEETHVCRSYDVSKLGKEEALSESDDSNPSETQRDSFTASSSSDTEEDDVRHACSLPEGKWKKGNTKEVDETEKKIDLIKVKEQIGAISDNDVCVSIKDVLNKDDTVENNLNNTIINETDTESSAGNALDDSDTCSGINNDKLGNSEYNDFMNTKVGPREGVEKTDLPECDQALDTAEEEDLVCDIEGENRACEGTEANNDVVTNEDICDILDSGIENKSETESIIELDSELLEPDSESNRNQPDGLLEQVNEKEEDKTVNISSNEASVDLINESSFIEICETTTERSLEASADKRPSLSDNTTEENTSTEIDHKQEKTSIKPTEVNGDASANTDTLTEQCDTSKELSAETKSSLNDGDKENILSTILNNDHDSLVDNKLTNEKDRIENNDNKTLFSFHKPTERESTDETSDNAIVGNLESPPTSEALQSAVPDLSSVAKEGPNETSLSESDNSKNENGSADRKTINCSECKANEITGSAEVEQRSGSHTKETVPRDTSSDSHEEAIVTSAHSENGVEVNNLARSPDCDAFEKVVSECTDVSEKEKKPKEGCSSSESGHSSGGESETETKDPTNVLKINVAEGENVDSCNEISGKGEGGTFLAMGTPGKGLIQEHVKGSSFQGLVSTKFSKQFAPLAPLRKAKRSTSSDGLSSSSDIERSDADASDSADTVIEGNKLQSKSHTSLKRNTSDEVNRDSDGPSSADSVLQGADSESQCSDGSEEGNLISIVAVGEETIPRPSSQGTIYIRSDLTDSDVQIKPTCIVVTGSSGSESDEDEGDNEKHYKKKDLKGNDVTILEVTSDHRRDHVMSVRVTSPESSRSASPARKSNVSELQSMILTTRERQQHFRRSTEITEPSSLTNYFTVTLGTESPATPRRQNKTPEVRRRKGLERDLSESPTSPVATNNSTSTLTPSPSHSISPTLTPTPDHAEEDLLAQEEPISLNDSPDKHFGLKNENVFDGFYNEFDDHFDSFNDLEVVREEGEGAFDSIDDAESVGESNYSETSSEEAFEREEELRGYCKRGYDFTLHTIIEESCEESDYDKRVQEEESVKRDPSELEKYFYFGLGNGPAEAKKFANEESEYSDTFSETSSSIYSEGMESLECEEEMDPAELASSRLEKYFSGFAGFERQPSIRSVGEESAESGSVGSDSEGSPSPEQPRKKLFRSRGVRSVSSNRSHGYSSDKGEGVPSDSSLHSGDGDGDEKTLVSGEDEGSTESDETAFDKNDGQFDTIKRRKKKKMLAELAAEKKLETSNDGREEDSVSKKTEINFKHSQDSENTLKKSSAADEYNNSKDKLDDLIEGDLAGQRYQSRDSGFIGSSDDLLRDKSEEQSIKESEAKESKPSTSSVSEESVCHKPWQNIEVVDETKNEAKPKEGSLDNDSNNNEERSSNEGKVSRSSTGSSVDLPPYSQAKGSHNLSRKDSFNNWSSDEETNIMMNKMRVFFKNMFSTVVRGDTQRSQGVKSPQLVAFESRLTEMMRGVPGINDEQVKEIVEYLSSEDTWSDSYDSSDYTSSDLEGACACLDQTDPEKKSELQEEISASCQQIIKNFYQSQEPSDTDSARSLFGGRANSESSEASSKDTAFVYQKLMSSMSHMKVDSDRESIGSGSQNTSQSLLMKIMPYIGLRLVALMHEVQTASENGDDADSFNGGHTGTASPRPKLFLPKKHSLPDNISLDSSVDKSSITSTSFESEDSPTDTEQSPESETGTPKLFRGQKLSIISERSSAEDFTSLESQRTVFSSHGSPRHHLQFDTSKLSHSTPSQRSLEDRSGGLSSHYLRSKDDDKYSMKDHIGLSKRCRSGRRPEARKAKSHLSLEKIHHEEMKATGERSESLGDLLDRVRSSSEFSSSYEQIDSDSTLKASDSLDRHIGSSSSNVRLNASSRGSLTTSSRGSLATSSRGSLNASSRGSLQGSSGPDEEEERKAKKLSFFRYARRSSVPDASKDTPSAEVRSTTLPRSTPAQILTTGTLPRSQSSQGPPSRSPSSLLVSHFSSANTSMVDRPSLFHGSGGPRSARYHPPGYRPPPATLHSKRTFSSTPSLRKDRLRPSAEESGSFMDDSVSTSSSTAPSSAHPISRGPPPVVSLAKMGSGSPLGPSLAGSLGRASGNDSVGGSLASFENSPDEEEAKRRDSDGGRSPLVALGPKSRSESLASVYSSVGEGRFGAVAVQGEVRVALQYNYKEGQLECHIIQSRDLAPVDTKRNRSDPYVKAYLLPDKSKSGKRKTKVKRHTLNPAFDEIFKFGTTLSEMESRTLWISVWHSDMFGRNVFLGEVLIPLSDSLFEDSSPRWYPLVDRNEPMEDLHYGAELIIALKFVPPDVLVLGGSGSSRRSKRSRGALQVRVKEASGLTSIKSQNPPDAICKGVLMPEKGKISKQKTTIVRKSSNPKWNHTMTFDDVTLQELTERSLELSIFHHDRFGSSEFLGGCRLNLGRGQHKNRIVEWLDASGLEQKLWEQMLDRPNLWVESSILLRPNIERPIYSSAFTD